MEIEIKHFTPEEMACKCGCKSCRMILDFMQRLEEIRIHYNRPMHITSGFRCADYDKAIGGKGNHSLGCAADVLISKGDNMMDFVEACLKVKMRRVILYHNMPHVHIDDNPDAPGGIFIY